MLYDDLIDREWATDQQFAEALAVGQVSPGPTGLWVICLGYLMDGLRGALLAVVAISLPPFLILVINRLYQRVGNHPAVQGFVHGLSLAVVSIFPVVLFGLWLNMGIDVRNTLIVLASFALGATRRVPLVGLLALAAIAGVVLY